MEATDLPESKPEHTELPWYVGRSEKHGTVWIDSDYAPSSAIADLYQRIGDDLIPKENAEANAAYIVQACNAYPELVKALREAVDVLDSKALQGLYTIHMIHGGTWDGPIVDMLKFRRLLKEAEGAALSLPKET